MGGKHVFRTLPAIVKKTGEVYSADPRQLVIDPTYNVRDMQSAETLAHIDWLAEEIEAQGFNPEMPLTVKRRGEDTVIVRGHCRLAACMKLIEKGVELVNVPVMQIASGTSDIDLIFDQEASNYGLRLDPLARARLVLRARRLGVSDDDIARRMHWKSVSSIKQHLDMLETLPEPVKEQVRDGTIAATQAMKVVKNLPAGTDPNFAADLIAKNKEENRKLGVGKRTGHKVTAKTLKRDKVKAEPKVEPAKPAPVVAEDERAAQQPLGEAAANIGNAAAALSDAQAQDEYAEAMGRRDQAGATAPNEPMAAPLLAPAPPIPLRQGNRIDDLLLRIFGERTAEGLAAVHARLRKEYDEHQAGSEPDNPDAPSTHYRLIEIADHVGFVHFPDQWDQVKANSELAEVA